MPRSVSCRRCHKVSKKSFCDLCRANTYGSSEYQHNSQLIRDEVTRRRAQHIRIICVICGTTIHGPITIEHITPAIQGGTNHLNNLGPAHAKCNYGQKTAD